jgi:hypothetical protein
MLLWIGLAIMAAAIVLLWRYARHADKIETDSSYVREEQPFTPYGQKYLDIMLFRGGDD